MIEINNDVVYVKGAKNGAIYDFNTGKVFSVNEEACTIIEKYIYKQMSELSKEETDYICRIQKMGLLSEEYTPRKFEITDEPQIKLNMLWLEITQGCNLRCVHCYEGTSHVSSNKRMNLNEWLNVIAQIKELDVSRVVVIGGEPCVNSDVKIILEKLSEANINTTLFTNATLLDDNLREVIVNNGIDVKVSVYGHNAKVHDSITQIDGSFDKLCESVKYLVDHAVRVDAAVIAMKENQDYMEEIELFVKKMGIKYSRYDVIRSVYGGCQNVHIPTRKDIIKKVLHFKPNFRANKKCFISNMYRNSCWNGKMVITEEGDILPCVFERSLVCGNVRNQTLQNIIFSQKISNVWNYSFENINECKECEYRFSCKDCRPLGYAIKGDMRDKNPRCKYNPRRGVWVDGEINDEI